jgi:hypothetical protein
MSTVELSWSTAEVKDAKLTVPLEGDPPKGWKQSFERTIALLGSGEWGDVSLKRGKVVVADVTPGSEPKLKHHLDAVVAQANATIEAEDGEDEEPEDGEEGQDAQDGEDQRSDPDAEMTERFRSE